MIQITLEPISTARIWLPGKARGGKKAVLCRSYMAPGFMLSREEPDYLRFIARSCFREAVHQISKNGCGIRLLQ